MRHTSGFGARRTAALGIFAALLLAACGSTASDEPGGGADDGPTGGDDGEVTSSGGPELAGRTLVATGITEGGAAYELVDGTEVSLDFRDSEVTARAGCNTIIGSFQMEGETLAYTGGAMTEMGCEPELHDQDQWLLDFLESQPTVAVEGDGTVLLTSDSTEMALVDRAVAHPPLPLEGTVWTVESIISADVISSTPAEATATLTFDGEGSLGVEPGCNTGGGDYELDGDTITLGPIATTLMACEGAKGELENAVLDVLNKGELTVSIEGDTLTLMAGEDGLELRGEESADSEQ